MRSTSDLTVARNHSHRELLNAIFYHAKTVCQWRNLPENFAPWGTVYHYFRQWKCTGLWAAIHGHLGTGAGCRWRASAGTLDSQTVKSTESSDEWGYDAGKKTNGSNWHLLVDTIGLILLTLVLTGNIQDRDGTRQLLTRFFGQPVGPRVRHIWADGGYVGALVD